jgi:hypothetical protein
MYSLAYALSYSLTPSTVATLNPVTMEMLQLFRGDTIIVRFVLDSLTVRLETLRITLAGRSGGTPSSYV